MARDHAAVGRSNVNRSKCHERWVANELTAWSGVQFRRRRTEGRGPAVVNVEGAADVIAVGAEINYSIEAKCGKGFSFDAMFASLKTTIFTAWWHQASYDATILTAAKGREIFPLLFFRPYSNCNWVALPAGALRSLKPRPAEETSGLQFPHLNFMGYTIVGPITNNVSHSPKNKKFVSLALDDVIFCRWKDFAERVEPASFFVGGLLHGSIVGSPIVDTPAAGTTTAVHPPQAPDLCSNPG